MQRSNRALALWLCAFVAGCGGKAAGVGDVGPGDAGGMDARDGNIADVVADGRGRADAGPDGPIDVRLTADLADVNAGDDASASYVGVWRGLSNQKYPISFVMSEDGTITDLTVRMLLTYEDGGTCTASFTADKLARVVDGRARLEVVQTQIGNFRVPIEIGFTSPSTAVVAQAGWFGNYQVRCADEMGEGRGQLIPAGTFTMEKVAGATTPPAADRAITAVGGPVTVGSLANGCSHDPASKIRHCAFTRTNRLGQQELFVVSNQGSGGCGTPENPGNTEHCRLLTDRLVVGLDLSTSVPGHRFVGNTLIFQATHVESTGVASARYHVWRPGWAKAMVLPSEFFSCVAGETGDALACVGGFENPESGPAYVDLWVGRLGDGTGQPLQKIARMVILRSADRGKTPLRYVYDYRLVADHLLWSAYAADAPDAKESLWYYRIGEPITRFGLVGNDISRWKVGARALTWLSGVDRSLNSPLAPGVLHVREFPPTPLPAFELAADVADHHSGLSLSGVPFVVSLSRDGSLQGYWESGGGYQPVPIDQGVSMIRNVSPGGTAFAYAKNVSVGSQQWTDLHVGRVAAGFRRCAVDTNVTWLSPIMSSSGRALIVGHAVYDPHPATEAVHVDTMTCARTKLGDFGGRWSRLPHDRFAVQTEALPLRKWDITNLAIFDAVGARVFTRLDRVSGAAAVAIWSDGVEEVIDVFYGINGGWQSDGLYHRRLMQPIAP
ncbi:MAG TPA: hypothetical protein VGF45_10250 [Polyangia bacterium]